MLKTIKRTIVIALLIIFLPSKTASAEVVKATSDVKDSSVTTFNSYYNTIPISLRQVFESENGIIVVYPEEASINGDTSGWNSMGTITGVYNISEIPVIYLNEKTVRRSQNFHIDTAQRVLCHEFGHYIQTKANQNLYGAKSFIISPEFNQAFVNEKDNWISSNLNEGFKSSYKKIAGAEEFYANIFAGLILCPGETRKTFPVSSLLVDKDIAIVLSTK